jgi:putative hydrolase of the HAD superfamily
VRAVLFDVDDTLVDHVAAQRAGLVAGLAADGVVPDEADHARWGELVDSTFRRYLAGELSFADQRRVRVRAMTGRDLDDAAADAWIAVSVAGFEAGLAVFDDVRPALAALRELPGVRLGAFSNVDGDFTRRKLGLVGLLECFDIVLGVSDVAAPKPSPQPFWALCAALDVPPDRALHVGDRWATDAAAARDAGLLGVWLDRAGGALAARRPPVGADQSGVVVVRSLSEVVDLARRASL